MNMKDIYYARMSANFRRWDREVDALAADGAGLAEEARAGYEQQLRTMRTRRQAAHAKLQQIRTASDSSWRQLQRAVDEAWTAMRSALRKATSEAKAGG